MIKDYFNLALKNLRKRKLRSWLTMIGIFISIATIFILISLSIGLENTVEEQFRQLGTDKLFIMPRGQAGAPGSGGAVEMTLDDVDTIEKVQGVKSVTYFTIGNARIEYKKNIRYFLVVGMPLEDEKAFKVIAEASGLLISEGRFLEKEDEGREVVMLGFLYKEVFEGISIKDKIIINDVEFEIKTILESVGNPGDDQNIYMPYETFKKLFDSGNRVDQIFVQVNEGEDMNNLAEDVAKKLRKFRKVDKENQDFSVLTPEELLESFSVILEIITIFLLGIAGISLLVGSIGIVNTMYTSVLERTKEIGTMKAIGAKNSDILKIFLIESGLLGLVGGIIGILLGIAGAKAVEYIALNQLGTNLLQAYLGLPLILGLLFFSFLMGSLAGILPARQASKLKPVDALRYE